MATAVLMKYYENVSCAETGKVEINLWHTNAMKQMTNSITPRKRATIGSKAEKVASAH